MMQFGPASFHRQDDDGQLIDPDEMRRIGEQMIKALQEETAHAFGTTATTKAAELTRESMNAIIDELFPPLYYGISKFIPERGHFYYLKEGPQNPECVVIHPDDLEQVREAFKTRRRLVHIKDEPREKVIERIAKFANKQIGVILAALMNLELNGQRRADDYDR